MTSVTCLSCAKLSLRAYPKEAMEGYGRCPTDPPGTLVNFDMQRHCPKFEVATEENTTARVLWWIKTKPTEGA